MNIQGICYIAKKYQSEEKDFKRFDKFAIGKIMWGDKIKDKAGNTTKSYTSKQFICFDYHAMDSLEACIKDMIIIEGQLRTEYYTNKEGDKKSIEKVIIKSARIYDKDSSLVSNEPKKEIKQEVEEEFDDEIPF